MSRLASVFSTCRAESRAALIGYLPAGFPSVEGSKDVLKTMVSAGCDLVEVGLPFSDPVLDGVTIQRAAEQALRGGFRVRDLFGVVESVVAAGGRAVVMTYWNPVLAYGVDRFARDLAAAGGLGVITPDLVPDEGAAWIEATDAHDLDRIFLVAPSSSGERIDLAAKSSRGFLYATSVMGVTGARDVVSSAAPALVKRVREHTDMPIGVGLGVRNGAQAAELAAFADGVIVGSAFVSAVQDDTVAALTEDLATGVRQVPTPA
ncbi:tryptophan synthase alpha chain [Saccharothrix ecbatanensis]|uniref:Tryptophan synthase alpha chain n=1 Tax=Saccharothrix ecbatanensis TaxID=1105145 RepID=A0A7W9HMW7_9PSEU|nr:tryptophan synthase subunit alpha [Saccharothrix ecbatanensis]MBB5805085.1 tryptophan synthase alpha chain [Saccharothrix ecbatanensis]